MKFFQARPLRGAMRAYVFSGIATARSVLTSALPRAGTTVSYALLKSNPAENAEPRVGIIANSLSLFTCKSSALAALIVGTRNQKRATKNGVLNFEIPLNARRSKRSSQLPFTQMFLRVPVLGTGSNRHVEGSGLKTEEPGPTTQKYKRPLVTPAQLRGACR